MPEVELDQDEAAGKEAAQRIQTEFGSRFDALGAALWTGYRTAGKRRGLFTSMDVDHEWNPVAWTLKRTSGTWERIASMPEAEAFLRDQLERILYLAEVDNEAGLSDRSLDPRFAVGAVAVLLGVFYLMTVDGWLGLVALAVFGLLLALIVGRHSHNERRLRREAAKVIDRNQMRAVTREGSDIQICSSRFGAANELCAASDAGSAWLEDGSKLEFYQGGGRWPIGVHVDDAKDVDGLHAALIEWLKQNKVESSKGGQLRNFGRK